MRIWKDRDGDLWHDEESYVEVFNFAEMIDGQDGVERVHGPVIELVEKPTPVDINLILGAAVMAYENTRSSHTPKLGAALTAAFEAAGVEVKK